MNIQETKNWMHICQQEIERWEASASKEHKNPLTLSNLDVAVNTNPQELVFENLVPLAVFSWTISQGSLLFHIFFIVEETSPKEQLHGDPPHTVIWGFVDHRTGKKATRPSLRLLLTAVIDDWKRDLRSRAQELEDLGLPF